MSISFQKKNVKVINSQEHAILTLGAIGAESHIFDELQFVANNGAVAVSRH